MTPEVCRELFAHGVGNGDLAIVEGRFRSGAANDPGCGGALDELCDWLDLPRLVVLDAARLDDCRLPSRPPQADGLLLDNIRDSAHLARLQTTLESLWKLPVLAALPAVPQLRAAIAGLARGAPPSVEVCHQLAAHLARQISFDRLLDLAGRRDFPAVRPHVFDRSRATDRCAHPLRIALAFDAAFHCYFPDTLDLLELHGAEVIDFSPLSAGTLPGGVDLVYLGCGHPELHAAALARNHCLLEAIREHFRRGGRIYAEGGGLAYLCEALLTASGERLPMVGAITAVAALRPRPAPPQPAEITLARRCWLGQRGATIRGYRNSNWVIQPTGRFDDLVDDAQSPCDMIGSRQAIGSRLHINFATQADSLASFLQPSCAPGTGH